MAHAISATGISKRFGKLVAVDKSDFTLENKEIHVLLGTNGCGKSTLCKVVAGALKSDSGEIRLHGDLVSFSGPLEARRGGIATVYQELSLIPTQSVAENILLGNEPRNWGGRIDRKALRAKAAEILADIGTLGQGVSPEALVGDLTIDKKQIVEIAKALAQNPSVILFDESTSSLDLSQVKSFFELVHRLQKNGVSIIFISHRMEEIFEIGDRVTVMRNGRCIATTSLADTDRAKLVELMVGETIAAETGRPHARAAKSHDVVMKCDEVSGSGLAPLSFDLRAGEIIGLGGLHGQGQSELLLTLFGHKGRTGGTVEIDGEPLRASAPYEAIGNGMAYVSGDRGTAGSLHGRPIFENMGLSYLIGAGKRTTSKSSILNLIRPISERLSLKHGGFDHEIGSLSGGNQQKVIIGRSLALGPRVLLLDDPTKGIDVNAKQDLFRLIRELCREGMAAILYSSEDIELLENSDRILVFNSGAVVERLDGDRMTEFELYSAALRSAS